MKVAVGDVVRCKTGEILKFEQLDDEQFTARVKSMMTGEWTDFRVQGASANLPGFLAQQQAEKLDPKDHPEPEVSA